MIKENPSKPKLQIKRDNATPIPPDNDYDEEYDDEADQPTEDPIEDNNAQEVKPAKNNGPKINLNLTEVKPFLPSDIQIKFPTTSKNHY